MSQYVKAADNGVPLSDDQFVELDFGSLWRIVSTNVVLIATISVLVTTGAVAFALSATPSFRAEVSITEVVSEDSVPSGLAGQLGGLAGLVGVSLSASGNQGRQSEAFLRSRYLVEQFVKRRNLIPILYSNVPKPPSLWFAVRHFRNDIVSIRDDKRGGVTVIDVAWKDPTVAAEWANGFVALANDLLRARAIDESQRSMNYLNAQVAHTNSVDLQHVMYNLIEKETKTLTLANVRAEYAFSVVDPAVPPEVRSSPKRSLIAAAGLVIGIVLGLVVATAKVLVRDRLQATRLSQTGLERT